MNLRRALFIAACIAVAAGRPAAAQQPPMMPWPGQQQQAQPQQADPWSKPAQANPFAAPLQQPQQEAQEACVQGFGKLRDEAQKRAGAIRTASEKKASAQEACGLFNSFSDAEAKMIKYAADNMTRCGIPPAILTDMKKGHARTAVLRTNVCKAAAAPARAAGPSLSDALGSAIVPDANNIKAGRGGGTYDTLTGTPLGGK
jgi:hypothetical protein